MARIIAVANQKGGVGKTTTCINLGASLVATKRRVLLVDLDPQGNATVGSGVDKHHLTHDAYDLLMGKAESKAVVVNCPDAGYDLIPTNRDLTAAEVELLTAPNRERRLREGLAPIKGEYDIILIDCPPSLSMLTVNALVAADAVMIPLQCEYYALEGLADLLNTVEMVRRSANPDLQIEGVLRTMFDPRNNLANDVTAQLEAHFGDKLYRTVVPRNIRLAEAPSHGLPVLAYDKLSRGAVAYLTLAGEMLRRAEGLPPEAVAAS